MTQLCSLCQRRPATQRHHKFPQHLRNWKHYGAMMDAPFNIEPSCDKCNVSHAHIPDWARWDEWQFRAAAEREGFKLPPPMRSCKNES
jgi:hypothetical protein